MTTAENIVVDGYDLLAEKTRDLFAPRTAGGRSLHRGSAQLSPEGRLDAHPNAGPTEPDCLTSGLFVDTPSGVYLDLAQGLSKRLVDDLHPLIQLSVSDTHSGAELAQLISRLTEQRLPDMGPCETVLSQGEAAARDTGIALAGAAARRRFVKRHGLNTLAQVMDVLGLPAQGAVDSEPALPASLPQSAPFLVVSCGDSLNECTRDSSADTTDPRPALVHVPIGCDLEQLEALFDDRPITEILETPGALQQSLADGRVPADLFAGFVVEVCQGDGGHGIADREWLAALVAAARQRDALVCVDEVQSFGRTGQLFAVEHTVVSPDILWTAPVDDLGLTVLRQGLAHPGFVGGGEAGPDTVPQKVIQRAWATVHLLTEHPEPAFEGRTLLANSRIKGEYLRMGLAELSAAHPDILPSFSGLASLWGMQVEHREDVLATAWRMGLKLIDCGPATDISPLRLTLLTDVLTHEIDQITAALDRVFTAVEEAYPDE